LTTIDSHAGSCTFVKACCYFVKLDRQICINFQFSHGTEGLLTIYVVVKFLVIFLTSLQYRQTAEPFFTQNNSDGWGPGPRRWVFPQRGTYVRLRLATVGWAFFAIAKFLFPLVSQQIKHCMSDLYIFSSAFYYSALKRSRYACGMAQM